MADQEEWSRYAPPMTPPPPPPPSPALPEDSSSDAILWAAADDCYSNTPHTDLLSLWLSNKTAPPQPEAEEEPLEDVSSLQNFDLESSFPDLEDWNTTGAAAVTEAPVVTEPVWMQSHTLAAGEVDDVAGLTLGIQSPKPSIRPLALGIQSPEASILPLALGNQFPEASVSPSLALGIQPPPSSFEIQSPPASIPLLTLGKQPAQASSGEETSPVALEIQSSIKPVARGIQFPGVSISPPIPPLAPVGIQASQTSVGIQSIPSAYSSIPSIPCTMPTPPPLGNFLPSSSPLPERRLRWNVFPITPPAVWQHLLLPHSASSSTNSPSSDPNHQTHHFFPAASTGYQQQVMPAAHAPATTISTPHATVNSFAGFVPASQLLWWQALAQHWNWTPNQPWIGNGQDMKLPIPRSPRASLLPVATTMPEPPPLLADFGSSVGNTPNSNVGGDVPVEDQQQVPTGKASKPSRKKNKLAVRTDNKKNKNKK